MRGIVVLCAGLVSLLAVGAARAGVGPGECGVCECVDDGRRLCRQDAAVSTVDCDDFCGSSEVISFSAGIVSCSDVPGCAQSVTHGAPAASTYGVVALLIGLPALGLWRLRTRSLAP